MTMSEAVMAALIGVVLMGVGCTIVVVGVMLFHHVMTWRP